MNLIERMNGSNNIDPDNVFCFTAKLNFVSILNATHLHGELHGMTYGISNVLFSENEECIMKHTLSLQSLP